MARRFRSSRGGLQAPKRQIANDGVDAGDSAAITFGATVTGSVAMGRFQVEEPALTLVRTRGVFTIKCIGSGVNDNRINGAFGIIVVSNEAGVAGLASLPLPLSQIENDWVVWVPFALHVSNTVVTEEDLGSIQQIPYDSRGMRKLKLGESLQEVVEAFQFNGTNGTVLNMINQSRMQFKL